MKTKLLLLLVIYNLQFTIYDCFSQDSMNVHLLYNWNDTTIPPNGYNAAYNETWAFAINGREYAVIGSTMGTHIFDVTNIDSAKQAAFIPGTAQGTNIVHRDFKSYQNYLYMVCDEGASTLQIADVSYLPDSAPLVYNSDSLFVRSHNIYIDTATAKMYVCGGAYQLEVYSLANPEIPVRLLRCPTDISWWQTTVGYVHDAYSRNDTVYCNAQNNGLFIVDFSNIANPQLIGSLTQYPFKGYNHSGWMNEAGNIYAFADETHGMDIKICDVSDLSNIQVKDTVNSNVAPTSIPHNIIIRGNYMYVSYYYDGLYIWNISNPSNAILVGFYDSCTIPNSTSYQGAWGVNPNLPSGKVTLSDMQNGLFVLDVSQALGVKEAAAGSGRWQVYPNPSSGKFTVSVNNLTIQPFNHLTIYNLLGEMVYRSVGNEPMTNGLITIDLSNQPKGIYFYQVVHQLTDKTVSMGKLIVE